MPTITFEEAVAKARAYGNGVIPIPKSPDTTVVHKSQAGYCDYCNKVRPVISEVPGSRFFICWKDKLMLEERLNLEWITKSLPTMEKNRELRLQAAQSKFNK